MESPREDNQEEQYFARHIPAQIKKIKLDISTNPASFVDHNYNAQQSEEDNNIEVLSASEPYHSTIEQKRAHFRMLSMQKQNITKDQEKRATIDYCILNYERKRLV